MGRVVKYINPLWSRSSDLFASEKIASWHKCLVSLPVLTRRGFLTTLAVLFLCYSCLFVCFFFFRTASALKKSVIKLRIPPRTHAPPTEKNKKQIENLQTQCREGITFPDIEVIGSCVYGGQRFRGSGRRQRKLISLRTVKSAI